MANTQERSYVENAILGKKNRWACGNCALTAGSTNEWKFKSKIYSSLATPL